MIPLLHWPGFQGVFHTKNQSQRNKVKKVVRLWEEAVHNVVMRNKSEFRVEVSDHPAGGRLFKIEGALTRGTINRLKRAVSPGRAGAPVTIDLSTMTGFDSFGAVFLIELAKRSGDHFAVEGAPQDLKDFVARLPASRIPSAAVAPTILEGIGQWVLTAAGGMLEFLSLAFEFIYWLCVAPFRLGRLYTDRTFKELVATGVEAIPIVLLISTLMGVILALNAASQLEQFGATIFVADLVGVALTKELGPVFTAILVAGRTGSSIAAELGTMKVTEEIDALKVMGINPRAFLVVPKILALVLAMPCLVIMADVLGISGGLLISVGVLDVGFVDYFQQTLNALFVSDILTGLFKSVVFGFLIGLTGATFGLKLEGGSEEVGRITTASVVVSFLLIILSDAFFTIAFTYMGL